MGEPECPSAAWDRYHDSQEPLLVKDTLKERLDAFGHLSYCVGFGPDDDALDGRDGDWLACFDFAVDVDEDGTVWVAYHVVVDSDSGGFVDTIEEGVVQAGKAPYHLPDYWRSISEDGHGVVWTEAEHNEAVKCQERWSRDLAAAINEVSDG